MTSPDKKPEKYYSSLSDHKRHGKNLIPPLLQIPNLELTSWTNFRLPEMLWAVLIISHNERDMALCHFRNVVDYLTNFSDADQPQDLTLTALSKIRPEILEGLLVDLCHDDDVNLSLSPLTFFPNLPGRKIWVKNLHDCKSSIKWDLLRIAVAKCYDHQSQESTDCRWSRVLYQAVRGKMHFAPHLQHHMDEYLNYPHFGDMRAVRPSIRAAEGAMDGLQKNMGNETNDWINHFWQTCLINTPCEKLEFQMEQNEEYQMVSIDMLDELFSQLITHCNKTRMNSEVNPKFDTTFGISLYTLQIFREIMNNQMNNTIIGRMALRSIVECFITLRYLCKNDNPDLWSAYRKYGSGQVKLALLKFDEIGESPYFVDPNRLKLNMTYDRSEEFVPIKLGNWENTPLRDMSEKSGTKKEYDLYYPITSGFVHGMWEAINEATYEYCDNPLHRFHRIPIKDSPQLNSIIPDAIILTNKILDDLDKMYPQFPYRLENK